eukprot:2593060-Prorocentrum_lima.AAC.1
MCIRDRTRSGPSRVASSQVRSVSASDKHDSCAEDPGSCDLSLPSSVAATLPSPSSGGVPGCASASLSV